MTICFTSFTDNSLWAGPFCQQWIWKWAGWFAELPLRIGFHSLVRELSLLRLVLCCLSVMIKLLDIGLLRNRGHWYNFLLHHPLLQSQVLTSRTLVVYDFLLSSQDELAHPRPFKLPDKLSAWHADFLRLMHVMYKAFWGETCMILWFIGCAAVFD